MTEDMTEEMTAYRGGRFSEWAFATSMAWSAFLSEAFPWNPILGTQTFSRAPTQLHKLPGWGSLEVNNFSICLFGGISMGFLYEK